MLFRSDAVMESNYLYFLPLENNLKLEVIVPLEGSVIYGCNLKNELIFSTTVEPRPSRKNYCLNLFDNRKGKGIKSNNVILYKIDDKLNLSQILSFKKDILPMRLFQYGCIQFPALASRNINKLLINPVAVKNCDGRIISID